MALFRLEIPPSTKHLAPTRRLLESWLEAEGIADDGWTLVVTELMTNAIEAADGPTIKLEVRREFDDLHLSVANPDDNGAPSTPFELPTDLAPGATSRGGRGISLVRALTNELRVQRQRGWTVVDCSRPVTPLPRAVSA